MTATAQTQTHAIHTGTRSESRQQIVHVVEYSRYPRRLANEGRHVAYTQDRSESGFCLDLEERVWPGELLQITLHDIDGNVEMETLVRVVWCRETEKGRARAGLAMLREKGDRPMRRVRRSAESLQQRN